MMAGTAALANGSKPEPYKPREMAPPPADTGLEISGHVFSGAGWQRYKTTTTAPTTAPVDVNGTEAGVIGEYSNTTFGAVGGANKEDVFKFFVDEFEVDLAKSFGENIRVRADLDFGSETLFSGPRFTNGSGTGDGVGTLVEQAYATANIPVGNGMEFLLGRFNAPMGFESNDVVSNDTISRSIIYRALRPHTFTGAKFYYAFSDMIDFHFYIVNSGLTHDDGDVVDVNTDIPGGGFRLGFHWGEEGKQSHVALNGATGQDHPTVASGMKRHITFMGDLDFQWWATDNFAIGGEGLYRQIDNSIAASRNGKYIGGLLNLHYDFSDVWDGTLKYAWAHDVNGPMAGVTVTSLATGAAQSLTGAIAGGQQNHEMALATNYSITDGAKLRLEGGYTYLDPSGAANNQHIFGFAGGFAYEF